MKIHSGRLGKRPLIAMLVLLALAPRPSAQAATYYVDKGLSSASDNNSGTETSPWASIAKGVATAVAGDTVLVKRGIYSEALTMVRSGSAGSPITFKAYPGHVPIIDGVQYARDKFIDWKGSPSGGVDKHYIIFDGFEVRNCRRWSFWIEGNYNIIRNCTIHDSGPQNAGVGILIRQGNNNILSNNDVYRSGWNGINAENSNFTTIEYNRSHDNTDHFGVNVFPNTADTQVMQTGNNIRYNILYNNMGGIYTRYQQQNEIVGNVIYNNRESGIFLHSGAGGVTTYRADTRIYYNTIVDNGFHGIWNVSATHLIIKNNIITDHTVADRYYEIFMDAGRTTGHIMDNNLYYPNVDKIIYWGGTKYSLAAFKTTLGQEANGLTGDPRFVDRAASNFAITSNSAAVDKGAVLAGFTVDLLGTTRPQGSAPDIGAYELASAPPPVVTNEPTLAAYYVDKGHSSASDNNSGTEASPWASIAKGVATAVAGDTILVKQGIYYEALAMVRSGSAGSPITFKAYPGHSPIIDGSQNVADKFIDWKGSTSAGVDKNYIIFDGFEVRNCGRWSFWVEGGYNIIRNCTIHDSGPQNNGVGILLRVGDYNVISSNEIYRSGWNGITIENSNFSTIDYNRVYDNTNNNAISILPAQTMQTGNNIRYNVFYNNKGGIYTRYQQANEIVGNVIYKNRQYGIQLHSTTTGPASYRADARIYYNTIADNGTHGIWNVSATHLTIKNNIIAYHTVADQYYEVYIETGLTTGHVLDNNLYYPNVDKSIYWGGTKYSLATFKTATGQEAKGLAADPRFAERTAGNYAITTGSAAVDTGATLEGYNVDLAGMTRPQGSAPDIGAYELLSSGEPAIPAPPTGLRVVPQP